MKYEYGIFVQMENTSGWTMLGDTISDKELALRYAERIVAPKVYSVRVKERPVPVWDTIIKHYGPKR